MKKMLALLGLFPVVLAGIVYALPALIGTDQLRSGLAQQLSAASKSEISLQGPIRFSLFPLLGVSVQDIKLVSSENGYSLSARNVVGSVQLVSFFEDQIRIDGIVLRDPVITIAEPSDPVAPAVADQNAGINDIFRQAAAYLEKLAVDRIEISNGTIRRSDAEDGVVLAKKLDFLARLPGPDRVSGVSLSGEFGGRHVEFDGELGSLRQLLLSKESDVRFSLAVSPPPHPAFGEVAFSGDIQLTSNGRYVLRDGQITANGQSMQISAAYVPGERHDLKANVTAGRLQFADLASDEPDSLDRKPEETTLSASIDLEPLRNWDVDIAFNADDLEIGRASARNLALEATLREGKFNAHMTSGDIARGRLDARLTGDIQARQPQFGGSLQLSHVEIDELSRLAGKNIAANGRISTDLRYAFLGTDAGTVRETVNAKGRITLDDGEARLSEIWSYDDLPGDMTGIDAEVEINDIREPVSVFSTLRLNGQPVEFSASLPVRELMLSRSGEGRISVQTPYAKAAYSGKISAKGELDGRLDFDAGSLGSLLAWLGLGESAGIEHVSYSGGIALAENIYRFSDAEFAIEDMRGAGHASAEMGKTPIIRAMLSIDRLDLATFGNRGAGGGETSGDSATLDLTPLQLVDARMDLKAGHIAYQEVETGPAAATLTVVDGIARLVVPEAPFYDGTVTANIVADGSGSKPAFDVTLEMNGTSALPLLSDAAGFERIEGTLAASLAVKAVGDTPERVFESLSGSSRIRFNDGALRGIDVARLLNNLGAIVSQGFEENTADRTEFTELAVDFDIRDGVAHSRQLHLLGPLVRMDGDGSIDVTRQFVDMRLNPRVVGSLSGQGGEFDVAGIGIPIVVRGPLAGPRIYPDVKQIMANPESALKTIARLREAVGGFGGGKADPAASLGESLNGYDSQLFDGVVGGILRNDPNGQKPTDTVGDVVGTLLQRVGIPETSPNDEATAPDQSIEVQRPASAEKQYSVPIPTPRAVVLEQGSEFDAFARNAPSTEEQITERLISEIVPGKQAENAADLLNGLLNRLSE